MSAMSKSGLQGCKTKFQNCLEKSEAVENQYDLVSFLSLASYPLTSLINQLSPSYLNIKWSSLFVQAQLSVEWVFCLSLRSVRSYLSSILSIFLEAQLLRAEMGCRGAALKAKTQLVSGRRRSVLLRLNSWSSLTLSYTILTDREILILTAFIFSPHCVWCCCKCIKLDWRTVLSSYERL